MDDAPTVTDDTAAAEPIDTEVRPADTRTRLAEDGYTVDIDIRPDGVHCDGCGDVHAASEFVIDGIHRYEGISDPEDAQSILALTCPCGCQGTATTATGAYGDSAVGDAVRQMQDGRRT